jgi:hypothetical protein
MRCIQSSKQVRWDIDKDVIQGRRFDAASLAIETDGDIDLRGFLGIDAAVPPGYENMGYTVRIKGSGTKRPLRH